MKPEDVAQDEIRIVKQPDGNYKGWMHKNGKFIEIRDIDPNTVLLKLLTEK